MARTNSKPLNICVIGVDIFQSKPLQDFIAKGHHVFIGTDDMLDYDVVIGANCWRIDPKLNLGDDSTEEESLERQLEMMEKGVRAIKYPKEKKDATND